MTRVLSQVASLVTSAAEDTPVEQQTAAANSEQDAAQVDWRGRALKAEARVVLLEQQLDVIRTVVGSTAG
jgi:hypothetical protein